MWMLLPVNTATKVRAAKSGILCRDWRPHWSHRAGAEAIQNTPHKEQNQHKVLGSIRFRTEKISSTLIWFFLVNSENHLCHFLNSSFWVWTFFSFFSSQRKQVRNFCTFDHSGLRTGDLLDHFFLRPQQLKHFHRSLLIKVIKIKKDRFWNSVSFLNELFHFNPVESVEFLKIFQCHCQIICWEFEVVFESAEATEVGSSPCIDTNFDLSNDNNLAFRLLVSPPKNNQTLQ